MRIADTFTSNMYITKLNWLPAKLNDESYFLQSWSPLTVPHNTGWGSGSREEGRVSRRAAQQPSKTIKNHAPLQQEYSSHMV